MTEIIHSLSDGQIIGLAIAFVAAIVAAVPSIIAAAKTIPQIIKNKNWGLIKKLIEEGVQIAEATTMEGPDKKKYVIERVQTLCNEMNIQVDVNEVGTYIDELIEWYNTMRKATKEKK